jgi:hypothetical protein
MAVQISGNDITVPRDGSFTRNVTIGGCLTYEDVTNIDSVGLVTARQGIEVGARPGVAASISVDGNMIVSGISTFGGDVQVPDKIIHAGDTNTAIRFPAADTVSVETGGSERVRIDSSGRMGIGDDSPDRELVVKHASSNSTIKIESANTHTSQLMFADSIFIVELLEACLTTSSLSGESSPIPIRPLESMRTLSLPPVSTETVSAAGNLIAVFVSPA